MANTTFSGPVRSQNGFQSISIDSTTGTVTVLSNAGLAPVALPNADVTITTVANSGVTNIVADVSADRTYTLPTPVAGAVFNFIYGGGAADGHDAIFTTGSDLLYFVGGVTFFDTDTTAQPSVVFSDGNSNSKLQVNLPAAMNIAFVGTSATTYQVYGTVVSTTAPTFADQ
jgi:hypothetical protein